MKMMAKTKITKQQRTSIYRTSKQEAFIELTHNKDFYEIWETLAQKKVEQKIKEMRK